MSFLRELWRRIYLSFETREGELLLKPKWITRGVIQTRDGAQSELIIRLPWVAMHEMIVDHCFELKTVLCAPFIRISHKPGQPEEYSILWWPLEEL